MRLVHVEHDPGRTATGIQRDLQVLDIIIESGSVEIIAIALRFAADFIVPQRFVIIILETAKQGRISGGAQRDIERIVDPAQPEAF